MGKMNCLWSPLSSLPYSWGGLLPSKSTLISPGHPVRASSSHQTTHFSCRCGDRLVPLVRAFKRHTYVTSWSADSFSSSQRTFAKRDCDMWRVPPLYVRCLSGKFSSLQRTQSVPGECVWSLLAPCPASALVIKLILINCLFFTVERPRLSFWV